MFPTFNEFRKFNNSWREIQKKEHQHKYLVGFYYPFVLIGLCLLYGAFFGLLQPLEVLVNIVIENQINIAR